MVIATVLKLELSSFGRDLSYTVSLQYFLSTVKSFLICLLHFERRYVYVSVVAFLVTFFSADS